MFGAVPDGGFGGFGFGSGDRQDNVVPPDLASWAQEHDARFPADSGAFASSDDTHVAKKTRAVREHVDMAFSLQTSSGEIDFNFHGCGLGLARSESDLSLSKSGADNNADTDDTLAVFPGSILTSCLLSDRITTLDLGANNLRDCDLAALSDLAVLRSLDLYDNALTAAMFPVLPDSLEKLDFRKNHLDSIPAGIARLSQLRELDVSSNVIASVAPEIVHLSALATLKCDHNEKLLALPAEVGQLLALESLSLTWTGLSALPSLPPSLTDVDVKGVQTDSADAVLGPIFRLPQLRRLSAEIWQMSIPCLTTDLGLAVSLRELILDSSRVTVPTEIGNLANLALLSLKNSSARLPSGISRLAGSCVLALWGAVVDVAQTFGETADAEKEIYVRLPKRFCHTSHRRLSKETPFTVAQLISYVATVKGTNKVQPKHLRMMLLGSPGRGKSSLANFFRRQNPSRTSSQLKSALASVAKSAATVATSTSRSANKGQRLFGLNTAEWRIYAESSDATAPTDLAKAAPDAPEGNVNPTPDQVADEEHRDGRKKEKKHRRMLGIGKKHKKRGKSEKKRSRSPFRGSKKSSSEQSSSAAEKSASVLDGKGSKEDAASTHMPASSSENTGGKPRSSMSFRYSQLRCSLLFDDWLTIRFKASGTLLAANSRRRTNSFLQATRSSFWHSMQRVRRSIRLILTKSGLMASLACSKPLSSSNL
jgi:hypothetical protein